MDRLPSYEIGMIVNYLNWSEFAEQGFRPLLNIIDNRGADPQMAREAFSKYEEIIDQYGNENVAHGSAFSIDRRGEPVFAYLDTRPLLGIFVRDIEVE